MQQQWRDGSSRTKRFQRRLNRWSFIALFLFLIIVIILYVANVLAIQRRGKEIDQLRQHYESLIEENERLQQQLYQLQAPQRIQRIAQQQLGLEFAQQPPTIIDK